MDKIDRMIRTVERHNSKVLFVRLACNEELLRRRIKNKSRKGTLKIKSAKLLNRVLKNYNVQSSIPHKESLVIDTSKVNPRKAARAIKRHYKLT